MSETVKTDFVVDDSNAQRAMGRMAVGADRLKGAFSGAVAKAAALGGGVLGVAGIARTVSGLDRGYQSVARIQSITGIAASEAHALSDAFENSGVEASTAEQIIMNLARKTSTLGAGTKEAKAAAAAFRKMGVDIEAGPTEMLLQMSRAARAGKLEASDLTNKFGQSKRSAADFMTMLNKGPSELKSMMDSQLKSADLIDDKALSTWQSMQQAKRNLSDAWGTVAGAFYKSVVPVVTKFLNNVSGRLDSWTPAAERFGKSFADGVVTGARVLGKVFGFIYDHSDVFLAIAKGFLAFKVGSAVGGVLGGGVASLGGVGKAAGAASGGVAQLGAAAGDATKAAKFLPRSFGELGQAIQLATIAAAGFGVAIASIKAGWGDLKGLWKGDALDSSYVNTNERERQYQMRRVQLVLGGKSEKEATAIALRETRSIGDNKAAERAERNRNRRDQYGKAMQALTTADYAAKEKSRKGEKSDNNFTQNNTFNVQVTQDFAPGFDPDKVKLAMLSEITNAGERRLMSGVVPSPFMGRR